MSLEQSGNMVFDTSVLVELALASPTSRKIQDSILDGQVRPTTGELNVTELGYVLCRNLGRELSKRGVELLRLSNQFRILPCSSFLDNAAEMKCARSISLVVCVTISMGESLSLPVLFARLETELKAEIKKKAFGTKIAFLNEK
jgi:hypothetical protein